MDPISTLNQAMLLLRQQLTEKKHRGERVEGGQPGTSLQHPVAASREDDLQVSIRKQVGTMQAAGVEDERQLFRATIETLLLREFGPEAVNDPSFQQMADWVCECLVEQDQTRKMLREMVRS